MRIQALNYHIITDSPLICYPTTPIVPNRRSTSDNLKSVGSPSVNSCVRRENQTISLPKIMHQAPQPLSRSVPDQHPQPEETLDVNAEMHKLQRADSLVKHNSSSSHQKQYRPKASQRRGCLTCWHLAAIILGILNLILLGTVVFFVFKSQKQQENLEIMAYEKENLQSQIESLAKPWDIKGNWSCMAENCYHFSTREDTWASCRKYCSLLTQDMLKIDSKVELVAIQSKMSHFHWIGLTRVRDKSSWNWQDCSPLSLDLGLTESSVGDDCAIISSTNVSAVLCTSKYFCLCESNQLSSRVSN
ncbi:C-type lectin domain family 1 member B-like [Tachyglossus aculeatus]|uniref:C-type lectin domain family 1 member B-like n=1 Tax=Tachyglossus aculeatus TaxID=9261 RepID=UPI0018F4C22D|nr:C-type lectin domain family 1 member B-like [Tachyglossus aculeatus]